MNSQIAEMYESEFEQLFANKPGREKVHSIGNPIEVGESSVEVFFSPEDRDQEVPRIISAINTAHSEIYIAMFYLTHPDIAHALIEAKSRGVLIQALWDYRGYSSQYSLMDELIDRGIGIVDPIPGLVHIKMVVIDGKMTILGSTNWTKSGFRCNDENLLIINDQKVAEIAKKNITRYIEDAEKYDQDSSIPPRVTVSHYNHMPDAARIEWRPRMSGNFRSGIVDFYKIYRLDVQSPIAKLPSDEYHYLDKNVKAGNTYQYYVTSVKNGVESQPSNQYQEKIGMIVNCPNENGYESSCPDDNLDNDGDNLVDCLDPDTLEYPMCPRTHDPALRIVEIDWDAKGDDTKKPEGESVELKALRQIDLSGWQILDRYAQHIFRFPQGFVVTAGEEIYVHSGCGIDNYLSAIFYWNDSTSTHGCFQAVWNNTGDTAYMRDASGVLIDKCFYFGSDQSRLAADRSPHKCN